MATSVSKLFAPFRRLRRSLTRVTGGGRLRQDIERFGTWTYPFDLGNGVTTPLHTDWMAESHETRNRMTFARLDEIYAGRWADVRCLDVACNEGFFGMEVCRRGAKEVVGFDARDVNVEKADFIKQHLGYEGISFHEENVSNLTPERFGVFELTLCLGLLYHLENPMDALRRVRAVTTELCVIDTQVLRVSAPVTTAWITEDRLIETEDVIGIIEEPDAMWNPAASVTGGSPLSCRRALIRLIVSVAHSSLSRGGRSEYDAMSPNNGPNTSAQRCKKRSSPPITAVF